MNGMNDETQASKLSPVALLRKTADAANNNPLLRGGIGQDRMPFVGFRVCDTHYLAPVSSVPEIIKMPEIVISVPAVKQWLYGLSNVRGSLLALVDFQLFLCERTTSISPTTRVLVIEHEDLRTGLIVPEASGLIYLEEGQLQDAPVTGGLQTVELEGREWKLFDMQWLVDNDEFRQAA